MPVRHISLRPLRETHCSDCSLNPVCLPPAVDESDLEQLDNIIERNRPLPRGGLLFHQGAPFGVVYAVRSGAIKTCTVTADGDEQVTGFYLPSEIVGLDSIGNPGNCYGSTAVALESTSVCAIPFTSLEELALRLPGLQHHLFKLLSAEIRHDRQIIQLIGKRPAEERLATLLLSLSARSQRRQLPGDQLHLPMSRRDIANHLGLALETVSRIFTRFQQIGILTVNGKHVEILDHARLCQLVEADNRQALAR